MLFIVIHVYSGSIYVIRVGQAQWLSPRLSCLRPGFILALLQLRPLSNAFTYNYFCGHISMVPQLANTLYNMVLCKGVQLCAPLLDRLLILLFHPHDLSYRDPCYPDRSVYKSYRDPCYPDRSVYKPGRGSHGKRCDFYMSWWSYCCSSQVFCYSQSVVVVYIYHYTPHKSTSAA